MKQPRARTIYNRARFQLLHSCCEEPFRIFFPAGVLLGVVGVSLWLLFYLGASIPYPNVVHARLMIEGFMASFIFGFLGTAGPRLTAAPHFSLFEVATIFTLNLLAAGMHTGGAHRFGDVCFTVCLLFFTLAVANRFAHPRVFCLPADRGGHHFTRAGYGAYQLQGQDRKDLAGQQLDASGSYRSHSGREQISAAAVSIGTKKSH